MYIDTHTHLTMAEFAPDLPQVISRAKEAGIEAVIDAGVTLASCKRSIALSREQDLVYVALGVHPHDTDQFDEKSVEELRRLAQYDKTVGIGETGLDYFYDHAEVIKQKNAFRLQLRLAQELGLPVIIHARNAFADAIEIIEQENKGELQAVFHCFGGTVFEAEKILEMGFNLSFTGIITFPKAQEAREVVKITPLERMMIETDCPFLAPQQFRGKRNEPAYVISVAEKIAQIKNVDPKEIARITTANARGFFKIA